MYVASVKEDKESGVPEKEWGKAFKQYIKGFQYIVSSGSPRLAKYDQKMHEKISDAASDAVFLGVCHGAQQLASAYGAKLKKTKHTHQGKRGADVNEAHLENPALEGTHEGGHMENYGHHKWYIPVDQAGSNLEVIAESESPKTKDKFVEMFKLSGKDHYGAQFHPEKGDGELIFNTFGLAHKKYKKAA
jgi:anthranilate/para-aminobenzoate synthase component II